jgi:hypothetical protein
MRDFSLDTLEYYIKKLVEVTYEQLNGFPWNLVEHDVGSLANSRQFWDKDGDEIDVEKTIAKFVCWAIFSYACSLAKFLI